MVWRFVLLFACLAVCPRALALDPHRRLTQYSHEVWLSRGDVPLSVHALAQTPDGYLWLGTDDGLVRFDGVAFRAFDKRNTPGILNDSIQSLAAARDGALWAATEGGLVCVRGDRVTTYTAADGLPHDIVRTLHEDWEGNLWVGTHGGGVARVHDGRFEVVESLRGLSDNVVRALFRDRDGSLWIGTDAGGLNRMRDGKITVFTTKDGLPSNSVWALLRDTHGRLWAGTFGGGLAELSGGRFARRAASLPSRFVRSLHEDRSGSLWIGTEDAGLYRYRDGQLDAFTHRNGLSSDVVRAVYEDREGSLWIGTSRMGLNRLKDGTFSTVTTSEGLRSDLTRVVYEDREGDLWIGTERGLHRFRNGQLLRHYSTRQGLSSDTIRSLLQDRKGGLWVGTLNAGLNHLEGDRIAQIPVPDGTVKCLLEDKDGALWIGTYGGGISRLQGKHLSTYSSRDGLSSDFVTALAQDRDGSLWIGTNAGGLSRLRSRRFTSYTRREGLPSHSIRSLLVDRAGELWVGTAGDGLCRMRGGRFTCYTTRHGLPDDTIHAILEDDDGQLWLSSRRGVFRLARTDIDVFDERQGSRIPLVAYGAADGMRSIECSGSAQPSAWRSRDGRLWFATTRGVAVVDPRRIPRNDLPPPVVLEEVLADHRPVAWAGGPLEAGPGLTSLELRYTGLSLLAPERVEFKYRLEGFDREWISAANRRAAYYTNLPPGRYRFSVTASNNDGVWNEQGRSLDLRVKPYFHQTRAFLLLCAATLALAAWSVHRYRMAQVRARFSAVMAERNRMARELHDTLEQGMMAVSLQIQAAGLGMDGCDEAREHLLSARQMLNESLTEARRSVQGLRSLALEGANLATALTTMVERLTAGTGVRSQVRVTGLPDRLTGAFEDELLRMGQEAVTNVLKHAQASHIEIELGCAARQLQLRVRDDGQGMDAARLVAAPDGHFGLVGMRERTRLLGGEFVLNTRPLEGTEVVIRVPIP